VFARRYATVELAEAITNARMNSFVYLRSSKMSQPLLGAKKITDFVG